MQVEPAASSELARLGGLEGLARSVMVGVVPLAALEALGSKAAVSYVFFGGATITLFFTLNVGWFEVRLQRRWVMTMSGGFLFAAAVLFTFASGPLFAVAIGLRSTAASIFSVCLSLYIIDYIGKRELTVTEARRQVYTGAAWLLGPFVGVSLWSRGHPDAPFVISAVMTTAMVAYFWRLRLHRNPVLLGPTKASSNPIRNVVRFFDQRNMRIAYAITSTRAVFWAALFIYGPIYVVEAGFPTWVAGSFLSVSSAMLFLAPLVGRSADRFGTRQVIIGSLLLMAAGATGLAVLRDERPLGLVFWLTGAMGGAALDVLGNIPFVRMVKPRERTAMTTVFSTWREVSFLVAPALGAAALALGAFWLLYVAIAGLLLAAAAATTFLPRRL